MFIPQDEACLQRMLGVTQVPEEILAEYMIRVRMLHRHVAGGPLGPIGLIDLLRSMGYGPPVQGAASKDPMKLDWRKIAIGTPVQVRINGEWTGPDLLLRFGGFVDSGTLAVEMPAGRVSEFLKHEVRLAPADLPDDVNAASFADPGGMASEATDPDARLELTDTVSQDAAVNVSADVAEVVANGAMDGQPGQDPPDDPSDDIPDDIESDIPIVKELPDVKWSDVPEGKSVWVRVGDDMVDAVFRRVIPGGRAMVVLDGEDKERSVTCKQMMLAE